MEEEMKKIIMLTALIGITACTTSQMAIQSLGDRYGDKHLDAFVLDYGAPHSAYEMQDGSVVYDWSSGIDSVSIPKTVEHTGSINKFGFYSGTSTVHGGGAMKLVCALKIITDKDKLVSQIRIVRDTWGHWETSRCNEIFG
jgi:hypothetical protein